jgi:hypothetical protein
MVARYDARVRTGTTVRIRVRTYNVIMSQVHVYVLEYHIYHWSGTRVWMYKYKYNIISNTRLYTCTYSSTYHGTYTCTYVLHVYVLYHVVRTTRVPWYHGTTGTTNGTSGTIGKNTRGSQCTCVPFSNQKVVT